jgi:hypothetical protein
VLVLARQADELERHARDQRHARDAQQMPADAVWFPDEREHDDADEHDDEQERRAAARMQPRERLYGLGRQRRAVLERVDRLVLGAVEPEHARHVAPLADEQQVEQERQQPEHAVDQPEADLAVEAEPARQPSRQHDEQQHPERERDHDGQPLRDLPPRRRLGLRVRVLASHGVGAEVERRDAEVHRLEQRHGATHDGQTEQLDPPGDRRERLVEERERPVGAAHGDRDPRRRAHHHTLEHRLTADREKRHRASSGERSRRADRPRRPALGKHDRLPRRGPTSRVREPVTMR